MLVSVELIFYWPLTPVPAVLMLDCSELVVVAFSHTTAVDVCSVSFAIAVESDFEGIVVVFETV